MKVPAPNVSLREITPANRAAVETLTVTAVQAEYVAGVAESLLEAAATPDACPWYRAVYADDTPVGFVMISDGITVVNPAYLGPYFLWRLLIDQRCQGRGHGSEALRLVVEHVRTRPGAGADHLGRTGPGLAHGLLPTTGLPGDRRSARGRTGARARSGGAALLRLAAAPISCP